MFVCKEYQRVIWLLCYLYGGLKLELKVANVSLVCKATFKYCYLAYVWKEVLCLYTRILLEVIVNLFYCLTQLLILMCSSQGLYLCLILLNCGNSKDQRSRYMASVKCGIFPECTLIVPQLKDWMMRTIARMIHGVMHIGIRNPGFQVLASMEKDG